MNVGILTAGGLCPGMNTIIHEWKNEMNKYNTLHCYGFHYGFKGLNDNEHVLINDVPRRDAGTALKTSRVYLDKKKSTKTIQELDLKQLYIIGGDGTHRAAYNLACYCEDLNVICFPKTIDNDIQNIERSFGFETAIEASVKAIEIGYVEASSSWNTVSVVELMGRDSNNLTNVSCDACKELIDIRLTDYIDENDLIKQVQETLQTKNHCVIVVAEGMKERYNCANNIHAFLKTLFEKRIYNVHVKQIVPSYALRGIPPNASDVRYCTELVEYAVHLAMECDERNFTVTRNAGELVSIPLENTGKHT